jgi:hypothetical protein
MKTESLLLAGAVAAVAGVLVMRSKQTGIFGGDAERMSGVRAVYGASAGQQAGVSAAVVASNWATLDAATRSQPDWWV